MRGRLSFLILKILLGLFLCPAVFGADSDFDRHAARDVERELSGLISPAVLIADAATGARLFAKGENRRMPPASLAKLMTLYLIHEDLERGPIRSGTSLPCRTPGRPMPCGPPHRYWA